ncbi:hypothetical protein ACU639_31250 [Streptomyces cynarae]|uniref:hypothetical protein n=1 Tax=Streptomyces cynarae TaxID=2981134 RepID=UPI00406C52D7
MAVSPHVARGVTVVGTASPAHHDCMRSPRTIPVAYGDGLPGRVRAAAPTLAATAIDVVVVDCSGLEVSRSR